ncbi:helix-turn-helix domain-containing protein [Streptomyces sp. NPDC088249]|uniref:helix-turn-helix domain-containing protein n=1 Tax=Streptomyces sp. NPDC088249 TaxID=3365843 RepID=UPI00380208D6
MLLAARGSSNTRAAAQTRMHVDTVRTWRGRFAAGGLPALADRKRSGRPPSFTPLPVTEVEPLACQLPAETGTPLSRWSCPELAREVVARAIASAVSASTVRRRTARPAPHRPRHYQPRHPCDHRSQQGSPPAPSTGSGLTTEPRRHGSSEKFTATWRVPIKMVVEGWQRGSHRCLIRTL